MFIYSSYLYYKLGVENYHIKYEKCIMLLFNPLAYLLLVQAENKLIH